MKKFIISLLIVCFISAYEAKAQAITLKGEVGLKVNAPAKEIVGKCTSFTLGLNQNGQFKFSVPVRSFEFSNNFETSALNEKLKSRFNDFYMESSRYPLIEFSGTIPDFTLRKNGKHSRKGKGILTVHGISKEVDYICNISIHNKQVSIQATAVIVPAYFNIRIPAYVSDFYFKKVTIELSATNK